MRAASFDPDRKVLTGWKEISAYLQKSIRTVQRFEELQRLPVRRVAGKRRGLVTAYTDELDQWQKDWTVLRHRAVAADAGDFRLMFEQALDAILITDDRRMIVEVNPAACRLLRRERDELAGTRLDTITPPELAPHLSLMWERFLAEGSLRGVFRLRRGQGDDLVVNFAWRAHYRPGRHFSVLRPVPAHDPQREDCP
ncbi:MAG TPA: PAS domain-containing protein [Terriglobales bacterium]|nr:PAS domain-containing protein [Terriglobales bacterium]